MIGQGQVAILNNKDDNMSSIIEKKYVGDQIVKKTSLFDNITSRASEGISFHVFDEKAIAKISNDMLEINRATRTLGRSNTQTTNKLMTLTMLNGNLSPYRHLRQCITQIEDRRTVLNENMKTLNQAKIDFNYFEKEAILLKEELQYLNDKIIEPNMTQEEKFKINKKILDIEKYLVTQENEMNYKNALLANSMCYIEGALKDIASFQDAYEQIRKSNGIPENWDELDSEQAEIEFHIKQIFLHAYRDIMVHGSIGMGTIEYMNQFGVHPNAAFIEVASYIKNIEEEIQKSNLLPNALVLDNWLDAMGQRYKNSHQDVLNRIGIKNLISTSYLYKDRNKEIKD